MTHEDKPAAADTSAPTLLPWNAPILGELDISRTANNPSVLSDGGVADCNHI
jgi:hypothetical protein